MTSLGRVVYFDQPGAGVSDPAPPTLELWADSITAVLDDLGSDEAVLVVVNGTFATVRGTNAWLRTCGHCFRQGRYIADNISGAKYVELSGP
jgi:hypothetical protein